MAEIPKLSQHNASPWKLCSKELPSKEARNAEIAVLTGNYQDAENILLQSGLAFR